RGEALGERGDPDDVAEQNADLLAALAGRRQIEVSEALVAPFAPCGQGDDHVGRADQALALPPACVRRCDHAGPALPRAWLSLARAAGTTTPMSAAERSRKHAMTAAGSMFQR